MPPSVQYLFAPNCGWCAKLCKKEKKNPTQWTKKKKTVTIFGIGLCDYGSARSSVFFRSLSSPLPLTLSFLSLIYDGGERTNVWVFLLLSSLNPFRSGALIKLFLYGSHAAIISFHFISFLIFSSFFFVSIDLTIMQIAID